MKNCCKRIAVKCAAVVLSLVCLASFGSSPAYAGAGDNYPDGWRLRPLGDAYDTWGMATRYCTSWAAWALHDRNAFEMPFHDDAINWGRRASEFGYAVNGTPGRGSIAWWDNTEYGHVAYVESVSADGKTVNISEYNNPAGSGVYNARSISVGSVSGYIHFKDLATPVETNTNTSAPSPIKNGNFNTSAVFWSAGGAANMVRYTGASGTVPYEGDGFLATNAMRPGDGISQQNPVTVNALDTFCASAHVVTVGGGSGGSGTLALWLLGGASNEVSTAIFTDLPGSNNWRQIKTCVTATTAHTYIKLEVYPKPGAPTIGLDAIDVHQTLNANGGFNNGMVRWSATSGTNYVTYSAAQITAPYEGVSFAATNTAAAGGSIFQDTPRTIGAGDTFCVDAQLVTVGNATGAAGSLALWLLGGNSTEVSSYSYSNLPGGNAWSPVKTCVTANTAHSVIRVQLYPTPGSPTVGVDALDVHPSAAQNGGFNAGSAYWLARGSLDYANYPKMDKTLPYEGGGFEAIKANAPSDSLSQSSRRSVGAGETLCAEMSVVTGGYATGGGGTLALWILGGPENYVSTTTFSNLSGGNDWRRVKTCTTANAAVSGAVIKAEVYPAPGGPAIGLDAVDVH